MKVVKLLLAAALSLLLPLPASAAGPTITMSPAPLKVSVGQVVPLVVKINDVQGLYGFDIQMKFDPAVVQVQDPNPDTPVIELLPGDFLSYDFAVKNQADNASGTTWYAMGQLNPSEAKSGSGTLFTIYVKGKAAGDSALTITYAKLADRNGEEIPVTWTNGTAQVTVASGTVATNPTPLPTVPAPQIGLTPVTDQSPQATVAPAPALTAEPAATLPAATAEPASTVAAATSAPTATFAPAAVASPTSDAQPVADVLVTPAAATTAPAVQAAEPAPVTPESPQAALDKPTPTAESGKPVVTDASAPDSLDAPTRVASTSQSRNANVLLFAGGGLLALAAVGAITLVIMRRPK